MKIINKDLKLFGKIHLLDILIIVLFLFLLVGLVDKFSDGKLVSSLSGASDLKIRVSFVTEPYYEESLKNIKIDDKLVDNKKYLDGKISNVEIIDYKISKLDNNGENIVGSHPDYKRANVEVICTVKYAPPVYSFGKQEFTEGNIVFLTTETINLKAYVTKIEKVK